MSKHFFDYDDGDFAYTVSDNMAVDMDSGDIHLISSWEAEDEDD